jgi:hypothetical protein
MFGISLRRQAYAVQIPFRAPNCNAHAERFRSVKEECLDRLIPLGERHLRRAVAEFVAHYHTERNHQGPANEIDRGRRLSARWAPSDGASASAVYSTTTLKRHETDEETKLERLNLSTLRVAPTGAHHRAAMNLHGRYCGIVEPIAIPLTADQSTAASWSAPRFIAARRHSAGSASAAVIASGLSSSSGQARSVRYLHWAPAWSRGTAVHRR